MITTTVTNINIDNNSSNSIITSTGCNDVVVSNVGSTARRSDPMTASTTTTTANEGSGGGGGMGVFMTAAAFDVYIYRRMFGCKLDRTVLCVSCHSTDSHTVLRLFIH